MKFTHKNKVFACALAVMMIAVCIGEYTLTDENETEQSDAIFGVDDVTAIFILAMIMEAVTVAGAYVLAQHGSSGSNDDQTRTNEASTVAEETDIAVAFYVNALQNYSQIWGLTSEHWIRQAELIASAYWGVDVTYDANDILEGSGVYHNSSYMMQNATVQMNEYLDSVVDRMTAWQADSVYSGNMTLNWVYGSNSFGSSDDWNGIVTSAVTVEDGSEYDTTYIGGGGIYIFGGSATITSSDGTTLSLAEGYTDLDTLNTFDAGIYTLQDDRQYAGSEIISVIGGYSAAATSAIVMEANGEYRLATYEDDMVVVDGIEYSSLSLRVDAEGGTSSTSDVTPMLAEYQDLISSIYDVMGEAASSASAVWSIFDEMGSACSYLTTLSVPDNYENVDMSAAQKTVMTTLTLTELAQYYESNSGALKTSGYSVSTESMSLFCRGDIYYYSGSEKILLCEDAIFTPYFYTSDLTITLGEQELDQYSICAVWADGENLSGWDQITDTCSLCAAYSGYYVDISEIYYDGASVSSVDLDVEEIDYIVATEITTDPLDHSKSSGTDWTLIFLIAAAIACALIAVKSPWFLLGDVACIVLYFIWYILPSLNLWSFL